jgi:outer membrane protein assembly factor BamD (BamD/ComL family)
MARERFSRKDLKQPDEFVTRGRDVVDWARDHSRTVIQIGVGLLVVLVIIGGFLSLRAARTRQANEDLGRALNEYRGERYPQAAAQFAEVAERWKSTPAGEIARIYAAQADLRADNAGNALSTLEEVRKSSNLPSYLQQEVLLTLGYAKERSGDAKGAAAHFQEAGAAEGPFRATAIYEEARLRTQLGEVETARKLQDRLLNEFGQSPEAEEVRTRLGVAAS